MLLQALQEDVCNWLIIHPSIACANAPGAGHFFIHGATK